MNIINYIKLHRNETFKEFKFTEVDNLILSLIPYIDFTKVIKDNEKITLNEALKKVKIDNSPFYFGIKKLASSLENTKRYGESILYNYVNIVNDKIQFQALTIKLNDSSIYIAFAGTDGSLVGWEENFKLSYLYPTNSQIEAINYLRRNLPLFSRVRIGGHSKGGNLAMASAMELPNLLKFKIKEVYNNDGPGFLKEQIESSKYQKIKNKIITIVPQDSTIGMLLYHDKYKVIKSSSINIFQHNPFSWMCNKNNFIEIKQTKRSKNVQKKISDKLDQLTTQEKLEFITKIFNIFKKENITSMHKIKIKSLINIIREFRMLDKDTQNLLIEFILLIFSR